MDVRITVTLDQADRALQAARTFVESHYRPAEQWRVEGMLQAIDSARLAIADAKNGGGDVR